MENKLPTFIDLEASSLRDISFPIEIAWSDGIGNIQTYLIKPEWDWNDWDFNAECVHGLSREEITRIGLPADHIARTLNTALRATVAYSDAPEFDLLWIERLFEASSVEMEFELHHFDALFPNLNANEIAWRQQDARMRTAGRIHRAGNDVVFLIELYKILRADYP